MIIYMEKISTGNLELDTLCGGGLIKGRSCLISGEPGTGKTTLALQFIHHGLENNHSCVYISIDEKPEQIIENAKSLNWNLEKYLDRHYGIK